jgi:glutamyl-tRNA reductase
MAEEARAPSTLIALVATPRTTPLAIRERLAVDEEGQARLLETLRGAGIDEAVVVATCDRTEIFALTAAPAAATETIIDVLAGHGALTPREVAHAMQRIEGTDAVRHLFMLAASLDSVVVGEPNVLGQLKAGWRAAKDAGMVGSALDAYLRAAFAAAKRVRTETALGSGPASLAAAAVDVARAVHGPLGRCRALLLGADEMAELVLKAMIAAGLKQILVADPLAPRALRTAELLDCHVIDFSGLAEALSSADIIVAALGGRQFVLPPDAVQAALKRRRRRPMVFFDCAVPRDIDPAIDRFEEAFRYDLDDLERLARDGHAARRDDLARALALIEEDIETFSAALKERDAIDVIVALRSCFERAREAALIDAGGDAARATRLLVNRLLHGPTEHLKAVARQEPPASAELAELARCLERLFELNRGETDSDE